MPKEGPARRLVGRRACRASCRQTKWLRSGRYMPRINKPPVPAAISPRGTDGSNPCPSSEESCKPTVPRQWSTRLSFSAAVRATTLCHRDCARCADRRAQRLFGAVVVIPAFNGPGALPIALTQLTLQDLARGRARQRVYEVDRFRQL